MEPMLQYRMKGIAIIVKEKMPHKRHFFLWGGVFYLLGNTNNLCRNCQGCGNGIKFIFLSFFSPFHKIFVIFFFVNLFYSKIFLYICGLKNMVIPRDHSIVSSWH